MQFAILNLELFLKDTISGEVIYSQVHGVLEKYLELVSFGNLSDINVFIKVIHETVHQNR